MITLRQAAERGRTHIDWLDSRHTFSFADYADPAYNGFGALRVINEDVVQPGAGFATHAHRDMEIITYVIQGTLAHKDSLGNGSLIKPGEIQRMSAGTGVTHSEFNALHNELLHFLQIWIIPAQKGLAPDYEQKQIKQTPNQFILIGALNPSENAVLIHQDVNLYTAHLTTDFILTYPVKPSRKIWLQLIRGHIKVNDTLLRASDGAAIEHESSIQITALEDAELLLFDLSD